MDFIDASSYFSNDPVYDAYTGQFLFYCRSKAINDRMASITTLRRRSMTTLVSDTVPARQAVSLLGDTWLAGISSVDGFLGEAVRRVWNMRHSTGLVEVLTPAQACAGVVGLSMHAQKEYYRDTANPRDMSDWDPMWNIYVTASEPAVRGQFVREGTTLFRIRNLYVSVDGLLALEADEFESDALQQATFTLAGVPDLVTDKIASTSVTLPVIQTDSLKFYRYRTQVESDVKPGDRIVFVAAASAAPQPGAEMTMLGARWRVINSIVESDARVLRVRLV